jgi:hypothetical protein
MEEIRQNNPHLATTGIMAMFPEHQIPTDYLLLERESSPIEHPAQPGNIDSVCCPTGCGFTHNLQWKKINKNSHLATTSFMGIL